ncbi:MAG TPA: universal stress protein [Saprospiraceae bacterium]|nr:universal stress protein [Saprospiraceae bacterium]
MKTINVSQRSGRKTVHKSMPVSIEIFGVRGYVYDVIRSQLQENLDNAGIDYLIQDVQKIDEFIAEGLEGVPTVRVDHKKSFTKTENTTAQEIVNAVVEYVLLGQNVQYVVCPIDFSEHSLHAASWAFQFSRQLRMQLKLIHIFKPIAEGSYSLTVDITDTLLTLKSKITEIAKHLGTGRTPATTIEVGDPLQAIVRISKDPSTGLIIMGTQGTTQLSRRLFGTISAAVARHTYAPVLLVPPQVSFKKPKQIMIAFHEELVTNGVLNKLMDLNHPLHAHLQFVHVQEGIGNYHEISDRLMEKLTRHALPEFSFDVQEIQAETEPVLHALLAYAEEAQPDIIVFVTRHRNLIRRLLHPGLTQKMGAHLKWPLLVMRNA